MPNWCYNTLTIQGPKDQVDSIKDRLNRPFVMMHDSWNPTTGNMEVSQTTYSNPVFAFHNIYNHRQASITDEQYIQQPPRDVPLEEQLKFNTNDWYSFNVREWGTKWDVAVRDNDEYPDTELLEHESKDEDQWLVYKFNTAWSPPAPAMEKLSALVPNCVITLDFEEETGWGGEYEFVNGEMTAQHDYENKCRDCDEEGTLDYCENDCGEICSACHYMGEADLELVAECEEHKQYLTPEFVPEYRQDKINV